MPAYQRLVDRLPTLWRPQPGDATLLARWLAAVGSALDAGAADIQHVLRAHWFDTADAAAWAGHFAADRRERGLGALRIGDAGDRREALRYPYVRDLARLGALLDLPPWRDPASLREEVEEYRLRVADVLAAYRAGLVTPAALRRLVDAALPEDMNASLAARRGAYSIEEPVALRDVTTALVSIPAVEETDRVAPLARWTIDDGGAGTPSFVIEGVAADAIGAATANPMIERYTPASPVAGIGVAYAGTLAPGRALRLAPARRQWLLRGAALLASELPTASNAARDPSANGPFAEAGTLAAGRAVALAGAPDGSLWVVERSEAAQRVRRFDGAAFHTVSTGAPEGPFNAIFCGGDSAWLGTGAGLFRCRLWPADGVLQWEPVAAVAGAVRVLAAAPGAGLVAAGAQGVWQLAADGSLVAHRHATLDLVGYAVDGSREVLATEAAVFIARHGKVWRYAASGPSEDLPDWTETSTPDNAQESPLPTVTRITVGRDGSLWLGGPHGLARWFADGDGTTRLVAFPDICAGAVNQLLVDDRGMLWIAGDDGLFRFDGRDLAQFDFAGSRWLPLADADLIFPEELRTEPRGLWRFDRVGSRWQRFDPGSHRFADVTPAPRAVASEAIADCSMLASLQAETGSWDGGMFTATAAVAPADLVLRIKPDETRCVDGAMPYLPANLPGAAWRYLQMDRAPAPPAAGRPWWSTEGQLFPPPTRGAPVPGHWRDDAAFLADPQREGQFDHVAFSHPPSARLWTRHATPPAIGIRVRLFVADPATPLDPAVADRVWQLIARARPAGVPLQLMAEGSILKESPS